MPSVPVPVEVAETLDRCAPYEPVEAVVARALGDWVQMAEPRTTRGSAAAMLVDEFGAAAKGETALPGRDELVERLRLLNRLFGSEARND